MSAVDQEFYTGRFSSEALQPVRDAAVPIPVGEIEEEDLSLGPGTKRYMPRWEALVRRLELLAGMAEINLQINENSPSVHSKALHAIAAAAEQLLEKLGAGEAGDSEIVPRQIRHSLQHEAATYAEGIGGFPNHPPVQRQIGDHEFLDYCADRELHDNIRAVAQIVAWAKQARERAKGQVGRHNVGMLLAAGPDEDPWTGNPINDALNGVCRIWREVLGRTISTSLDAIDGTAGGPLIRFSLACLNLLEVRDLGRKGSLSSNAVRKRIRDLQEVTSERRPVRKGRRKTAV
jgi:hypothetical protein